MEGALLSNAWRAAPSEDARVDGRVLPGGGFAVRCILSFDRRRGVLELVLKGACTGLRAPD